MAFWIWSVQTSEAHDSYADAVFSYVDTYFSYVNPQNSYVKAKNSYVTLPFPQKSSFPLKISTQKHLPHFH
jgi:hypothetical protein